MISEDDLEGLLVLEPRADFDAAMVGVVVRFNQRFALYSKRKVIAILLLRDRMDEASAYEHFEFNMNGGWYGEGTWGFLEDDNLLQSVDNDREPGTGRRVSKTN
jgi:hypothetical protein